MHVLRENILPDTAWFAISHIVKASLPTAQEYPCFSAELIQT